MKRSSARLLHRPGALLCSDASVAGGTAMVAVGGARGCRGYCNWLQGDTARGCSRAVREQERTPSNGLDVITLRYDERPWTANSARSAAHWSIVARKTAKWRQAWRAIGIANKVIDVGPCIITVTPYLRDGRGKQDVAACFPAAKAAIDGLCDCGAWDDDDPSNVVELRFRPPVRGEGDGLELIIEPVNTLELGGPHLRLRVA